MVWLPAVTTTRNEKRQTLMNALAYINRGLGLAVVITTLLPAEYSHLCMFIWLNRDGGTPVYN
jgi:hypothetical protein